MRNRSVKKFHPGLALGTLVGGAFLAHAAFAQTPALPLFGPAVAPGRQLQLNDFTTTNPLIPSRHLSQQHGGSPRSRDLRVA